MLCCLSPHDTETRPPKISKRPTRRDSPTSIPLPASTVPYASSTAEDLRDIFATNATPNGYSAAKNAKPKRPAPQGSLDLSFQFGPVLHLKKPSSSVEHLSTHLRQKFSRSRLGKSSSSDHPTNLNTLAPPGRPNAEDNSQLLGVSQRSTGLSELLTSRAASEGGYDSDAKSIKTPLTRSNAGTFHLSPRYARKSLKSILPEFAKAVPNRTDHNAQDQPHSNTSTPQRHEVTPGKQPFSSAIQVGPQESPSDTLRRVNMGLRNGTVEALDTPELRAVRLPNHEVPNDEWPLSMSAPRRTSSLSGVNERVGNILDLSRQQENVATRNKSGADPDSQRLSMLSNFDPDLLSTIEQYARGAQIETSGSTKSLQNTLRNGYSLRPAAQTSDAATKPTLPANVMAAPDICMASEDHSLHLFDMRISQRLASNSQVNASSAETSKDESSYSVSASSESVKPAVINSTNERYPTLWCFEHNRRPSDPSTRRLFEDPAAVNNRDKSSMGLIGEEEARRANTTIGLRNSTDTADSIYPVEIHHLDGASGQITVSKRPTSGSNKHSIAIGGRSVSDSGGVSLKTRVQDPFSKRSLQVTKPSTMSRSRGSSHAGNSKPSQRSSTFPLNLHPTTLPGTPTPKSRNIQTSDSDERMSYETFSHALNPGGNDSVTLSTSAGDEQQNETLSLIDLPHSYARSLFLSGQGPDIVDRCDNLSDLAANMHATQHHSSSHSALDTSETDHVCVHSADDANSSSKPPQPHFDRQESCGDETEPRLPMLVMIDEDSSKLSPKPSRDIANPHLQKRSHSTDDIQSMIKWEVDIKKTPAILRFVTDHEVESSKKTHLTDLEKPPKLKISLQSLVRKLSSTNIISDAAKAHLLGTRKSLGFNATFPLHRRALHTRSSGFLRRLEFQDGKTDKCNLRSGLPIAKHEALACNLNEAIGKDLPMLSSTRDEPSSRAISAEPKESKKGLFGRFRHLYGSCKPETACTPSFGSKYQNFGMDSFNLHDSDGEKRDESEQCGQNEVSISISPPTASSFKTQSEPASSSCSMTNQGKLGDAGTWSQIYADCVGSYSALNSDYMVNCPPESRARFLSLTSTLRESTVGFDAQLQQEAAMAKAYLLQQVSKNGDERSTRPSSCQNLKMPGSFD